MEACCFVPRRESRSETLAFGGFFVVGGGGAWGLNEKLSGDDDEQYEVVVKERERTKASLIEREKFPISLSLSLHFFPSSLSLNMHMSTWNYGCQMYEQ